MTTEPTVYVGTVAVKIQSALSMLERAKNDRYATPRKDIRKWIAKADLERQYNLTGFGEHNHLPIRALDSGCGIDARWANELYEEIKDRPYSAVIGVDINPDAGTEQDTIKCFTHNYLDYNVTGAYNLIIGNPPFNLANAWLQQSFKIVQKEVGRVSFLFPITLASTKARREMYRTYPISRMQIYTTRVSFEGYTGTYPAREYAQFEWWFKDGRCLKPSELAYIYGVEPLDYLD